MRIVCPNCLAEYEVPTSSLKPQRKARCSRCGTEWLPVQEAQVDLPETVDGPPLPAPPPQVEAKAMDRLRQTAAEALAGMCDHCDVHPRPFLLALSRMVLGRRSCRDSAAAPAAPLHAIGTLTAMGLIAC